MATSLLYPSNRKCIPCPPHKLLGWGPAWAWPGQLAPENQDFRKFEGGLGSRFWHPYLVELSRSVRIDLGTPYGCTGARGEGFGNVGFLTEMVGCEFFVFGEFGLGLMGVVGDGGWAEPVRNEPYFWYGPIWMPLGPLGGFIWTPRPIFPNFQIFALGNFLESFRGGPLWAACAYCTKETGPCMFVFS